MKAITRIIFLDENNEKFFGEGPYRLLKLVNEVGSLKKASETMGMAYTKALKLLNNSERVLGFKLTERTTGGSRGGGSHLTQQGFDWLNKYEAYRDACVKANEELYSKFYND